MKRIKSLDKKFVKKSQHYKEERSVSIEKDLMSQKPACPSLGFDADDKTPFSN